jgi:hypothetical protein
VSPDVRDVQAGLADQMVHQRHVSKFLVFPVKLCIFFCANTPYRKGIQSWTANIKLLKMTLMSRYGYTVAKLYTKYHFYYVLVHWPLHHQYAQFLAASTNVRILGSHRELNTDEKVKLKTIFQIDLERWDSSVSIAIRLWTGWRMNHGSIPSMDKRFFFSP